MLIVNLILARRDNYGLESISHRTGRYYDMRIRGKDYIAVVLPSSFQFYEMRYHLAEVQPDVCVCQTHDTVLSIPVLALDSSNLADPYAIPEQIKDLKQQRWSKRGFQVLLGLYLIGVHRWVDYVESLPTTTRKRYHRRAKELVKRPAKGGRPVGLRKKKEDGKKG